jgi:large repetitive protein
VSGVAWNVKLMALRAFGKDESGEVFATISDLVKSVNYITDQKKRGVNVRVINASLGGTGDNQSLRSAIEKAGNQGILFVCSAGNDGADADTEPEYPAAWAANMSNVISVAALNRMDTLSFFSVYGHNTISVAAPGEDIFSTFPGGDYEELDGTSMAAPHVSGIAALLWSSEPGLTPTQVKERIIRTSEPMLSAASRLVGSGRANAFNALTNTVPPAPPIGLASISTDKKFVTVDGLGFINNQRVRLEVNGAVVPGKVLFDSAYSLANGSFTRARIKIGKPAMNANFPSGFPVSVVLVDPLTGARTAPVLYSRRAA